MPLDSPSITPSGNTSLLEDLDRVSEPTWSVVLHNDPVNLVPFVVATLRRVLQIEKAVAQRLTQAVELNGKASVLSASKDKCTDVSVELGQAGLWASIERAGEPS
jgi:ATP-dependent Clp protease adapter protein ClpS